jgi:predicted dehydrogenase
VNRFDVIGERGALSFDGVRLLLGENDPATAEFSRSTREMFGMPATSVRDITPDRAINQHAAVLNNFVAAILRDEALIAPAAAGLDSLALANSMLLSTWEARPVTLPLSSVHYQQALAQRIAGSALRRKAAITPEIDMQASYR